MLNSKKTVEPTPLDEAITHLYSELAGYSAEDDAYPVCIDQIVKLEKLRKEIQTSWRPSPDAVLSAAGGFASILMILQYERLGHITSKALGFVGRLK